MRTISLKLPERLLVRVEKEAKARRISRSRLMRESIEQTLNAPNNNEPSAYDLIAGFIKPPKARYKDLATNPKYMEGFGE